MQKGRNDRKVEKSVSMHSYALERPCKRQIVTDAKSCNASHIFGTHMYFFYQLFISAFAIETN